MASFLCLTGGRPSAVVTGLMGPLGPASPSRLGSHMVAEGLQENNQRQTRPLASQARNSRNIPSATFY